MQKRKKSSLVVPTEMHYDAFSSENLDKPYLGESGKENKYDVFKDKYDTRKMSFRKIRYVQK